MQKPLPETTRPAAGKGWGWLPLAAAGLLGLVWLILAFSDPFVLQDDVRQHVVWFEALRDPALFQGDFIATFFVSNNTPIYKAFYWLPAQLGLSPLLMAKLYPVGLSLLTAWLAYRFFASIGLGVLPAALGAVLFVQGIWVSDDIASATARAFSWPLMLAVLVCWRERRWLTGAALGFALSLTYPTAAVFAGAMIGLMCLVPVFQDRKPLAQVLALWSGPAIVVAGLFAGALTALALGTGEGGVSGAEARQMAEFQQDGRTVFFVENPIVFWLLAKRSGALPEPVLRHAVLTFAALLAVLRWKCVPQTVRRLSLAALLAGLVLWAAAHLLLFKLYLPGRFSLIGERMAFGMLASAGLAVWLPPRKGVWQGLAAALVALPLLALLVPLRANPLFNLPESPRLIEALRATPPETLVAGFSPDLDNIPANSLRRVLTAREYHLPYDKDYVLAMRDRLADTAAAVFAQSPAGVRVLVERYGVTHLLIARREVTPEGARQSWWWPILAQENRLPDCTAASCRVWALEQTQCLVAEEKGQALLSAACLLGRPAANAGDDSAAPRAAGGGHPPAAG